MTSLDKSELAKIGVQFGNLVRKWNPQMRPYIYGKTKNKTHILDLQKIIINSLLMSLIIALLGWMLKKVAPPPAKGSMNWL